MLEIWIIFALLAALGSAGIVLVNDRFKVDELALLLDMRIIAFIVSACVAVVMPAPSDPLFYVFVMLGSLGAAYMDQVIIRLASAVGAGVVARIEPLGVAATFLLWLLIMPSLIGEYLQDWPRLIGILASLASALYFSFRLKKCAISAGALKAMIPVILAIAVTINLGKLAMNHADEKVAGVVWYLAVQCSMAIVFYTIRLHRRGRRSVMGVRVVLLDRRVLYAALCLSVAWLIHVPAKYYAISMVENPSYVTILELTVPLWIMLFYRMKKHREIADVKSGLGIVISAVFFIIFTQM